MPTSTIDLGREALAYASRGFLIFPLWHVVADVCACADGPRCGSPGKHPRTRRGLTEASSDEKTVERWWALWPDANIGLPAGANGLAAIDLDFHHGAEPGLAMLIEHCERHGVDLLATRAIRTGSGGMHLIYREPPGGIKTAARTFGAEGIDTRGRGGYIVAPPSLHASGNRYEVIDTGHGIAPWPACLDPLIDPPAETGLPPGVIACGPQAATAGDRGAVWAFHALLAETKALADLTAPTGDRNNRLNIAAYKLGRRVGAGFLGENDVAEALYQACRGWRGHTERELRATIRSGIRAGIAKPHEGPTTRGGAR